MVNAGMSDAHAGIMIFTGNANPALAAGIASHLGLRLGKAKVGRFSDGEISVEIEENVRKREVYIVQPTCPPVNDTLMELLILIDALWRASAKQITAVIPYFGYSRQDRRPRSSRVPITAKLVANMVAEAGASRVVTVDLHSEQVQGFFDIPVDNIYASPVLLSDIWRCNHQNPIVVSPDVGGVVRARAIAKQLGLELAIIDKRRPHPNEAKVMHVIGNVEGRTCILVDDIVDTGGTLCEASRVLKAHGAVKVVAYCTHPILSGPAPRRIWESELDELVVTNTLPLRPDAKACPKIRQLKIDELLAETIRRMVVGESVSSLYVV